MILSRQLAHPPRTKPGFAAALPKLIAHEGGFVNHPSDPGGMTNLGVTRAVWQEWTGRPATEADMRALTPAAVAPLYRARYWDAVRADDLPAGVDYAVFDAAVNSGPARAVRWLQQALGLPATGVMDGSLVAVAGRRDPVELITAYTATRLRFLQGLRTWPTFGRGWARRVNEVAATATAMSAQT